MSAILCRAGVATDAAETAEKAGLDLYQGAPEMARNQGAGVTIADKQKPYWRFPSPLFMRAWPCPGG